MDKCVQFAPHVEGGKTLYDTWTEESEKFTETVEKTLNSHGL